MRRQVAGWLSLVGIVLTIGAVGPARADDPLDLRVSPAHSFAPALVRIQVLVQPIDANRRLVVSVESSAFFRRSDIQLDGSRAPRIHEMAYDGLPPGEYTLQAQLHGAGGAQATEQRAFVVIGDGGSGDAPASSGSRPAGADNTRPGS